MESKKLEQLDILATRNIAKFFTRQIIFYRMENDKKVPARIYLDNINNILLIKAINDIKVIVLSLKGEIVCCHKVRVTLKFRIALFIEYEDKSLETMTLPCDCRTDEFIKNNFPVYSGDNEFLNVDRDDFFIWKIDIPVKDFDEAIPLEALEDSASQFILTIKKIEADFDLFHEHSLAPEDSSLAPLGPCKAIEAGIFIIAELLVKFCIQQEMLVYGTLVD